MTRKAWDQHFAIGVHNGSFHLEQEIKNHVFILSHIYRQEHTGPTTGCLKRLERLGRGREQICSVCSAVLEAFGAARMPSAPNQHAKSEEVCCQMSEPLDSLIGGVLANQRGVCV